MKATVAKNRSRPLDAPRSSGRIAKQYKRNMSEGQGRYGTWWMVLWETVVVAVEVLFQKLWMLGLPSLRHIGEGEDDPVTRKDRYCIVTGPTSGIGREAAQEMYRRGWNVVLACRNETKGRQLAEEMRSENGKGHGSKVKVMLLDVSSLQSVRDFAEEWRRKINAPVHVLINNAGIFAMSASRTETVDRLESHMGTNFVGHFLLTELMMPWMAKAQQQSGAPARVVNVSSKLHRMGTIHTDDPNLQVRGNYNSLAAYSQSKLAQVMFSKECNRKHAGIVQCVSVHPGEVLTDVVRSLPLFMQHLYRMIMRLFLLTPAQGARSTVYCATSSDLDTKEYANVCYVDSNCRPGSPHPSVYDEALLSWLWQWSVDITHNTPKL